MAIDDLLRRMRDTFGPFNDPAGEADLRSLQKALGPLPEDVLRLYRDHDGSNAAPPPGEAWLPARLLPVREAIETNAELTAAFADEPRAGEIAWLWTDDNSNYVGVYTSGELKGWLTKVDHEEPLLTPAYRSVAGFLRRFIEAAPGVADESEEAVDVVMVPREVPVLEDDPAHVESDRRLARLFRERHAAEGDETLRRFYAECAICLTPAGDTASLLPFLSEDDMWVPESAIRLLELRRYVAGIEHVERVARGGKMNGYMAAIRMLVRLRTPEAESALRRLEATLSGRQLQTLRDTIQNRHRLHPRRRY